MEFERLGLAEWRLREAEQTLMVRDATSRVVPEAVIPIQRYGVLLTHKPKDDL